MNARQQAFFRARLVDLKQRMEADLNAYFRHWQFGGGDEREPGPPQSGPAGDGAEDAAVTLMALLEEVDAALERLNKGTYGYCQETGEPIGIERLLEKPIAQYTEAVEARRR